MGSEKVSKGMKINLFLKKTSKKSLAIDFGQAAIKMLLLESLGSSWKVLAYGIKNISQTESLKDEAIGFIQGFLKTNAVSEKEVCLVISEPDSFFIKNLTLPQMPKEELVSAIHLQIKSELPFASQESIFDFQVIREYADEERGKKIDLICVFARASTLDKYLSIAKDSGLMPVRVSCSPFDYAVFLRIIKSKAPITAILDVGFQNAHIALYKDSLLFFVRELRFSTAKLLESLQDTLVTEKGRITISPEQAKEILHDTGIPFGGSEQGPGLLSNQQLISLMRPTLETLVRELGRSFDYVISNLNLGAPSILYLAGGGSKLKNLAAFLSKELGFEVASLDIPSYFDVSKVDEKSFVDDQNQIIGVLGAALLGTINLLPQAMKAQRFESFQRRFLRNAGVIFVGILLLFFLMFQFQSASYSQRIKIAKVQVSAMDEINKLKRTIGSRESLQADIQKNKVPVSGLLKALSVAIASNVFLDEMSFDQKDHILILRGIVLAGEESSQSALVDFIKKIRGLRFFTETSLVASKQSATGQQFEIKCTVVH